MSKKGSRKSRKRTEVLHINFKTTIGNVAPISMRALSRNGPYVDAHFKNIDAKNPIGQTYYLRPITEYNGKTRVLTIKLNQLQPTVHMNTNTVSSDVCYNGTITITNFRYGGYNPNSVITASMTLHNGTGRELIGFHIHDGELVSKGKDSGFTNFGPIVYFLYTTAYWNKKKEEKAFPLPPNDVTPMTDFTLRC
jgi:hypothetical protein